MYMRSSRKATLQVDHHEALVLRFPDLDYPSLHGKASQDTFHHELTALYIQMVRQTQAVVAPYRPILMVGAEEAGRMQNEERGGVLVEAEVAAVYDVVDRCWEDTPGVEAHLAGAAAAVHRGSCYSGCNFDYGDCDHGR